MPETQKNDIEKRSYQFNLEVETRDDEPSKIIGHAAIFNEYTDIWWFQERIMPGAFTESIKVDDVRALFNHNPDYPLGRNTAGTLEMKEDKKGLAVEINPPDTQVANDLQKSIKRGDVSQMSFAFEVLEEKWVYSDDGKEPDKRDIQKVKLYDVSPVTYPAYENTDVAVRSHKRQQEQRLKPKQSHRAKREREMFLMTKGGKQL
ncbi:MAG: HK97 family phage prohead protease [Gammaproteobacteria bacterium]|nr:HK97 family phage prohead protease [Gammaproteobacteria bacterium]